MTPIFKNINVIREDIGKLMKEYAVKHKLLRSSWRMLIGTYNGDHIHLAIPLLQWYLQKKLVVTKIHQVIEYQTLTCFKKFDKIVADPRRDGDRDDDEAIKSDTMKLLGNAA